MTSSEIILRRLSNQQITRQDFDTPSRLLHWMLAMQAQDFAMAKWAMGLRLKGTKEMDIDKAFNEGSILRTHLLRPTWHFVCPSDIRWLTRFTAPRIRKIMKSYFEKMEMDVKMLKKGNALLATCLQGNNHLDRNELKSIFQKSKLNTDKERMSFFLMGAELDEIVCSAFQLRGEGKTDIRTEGNTAIHFFVVNGKYAGNWTRCIEKNIVKVKTKSTTKLSAVAEDRLNSGIRKYENFFKRRRVKIE